jgi:hypothetical protein
MLLKKGTFWFIVLLGCRGLLLPNSVCYICRGLPNESREYAFPSCFLVCQAEAASCVSEYWIL